MPEGSIDKEKARRAARDPNRPGEECRAEEGAYEPVVDRSKCEGKSDCVDVCPYGVFEVRRMEDGDFDALGFFARMKSRAHGRKTAYTPHVDRCKACGLCVVACPEDAIKLVRISDGLPSESESISDGLPSESESISDGLPSESESISDGLPSESESISDGLPSESESNARST